MGVPADASSTDDPQVPSSLDMCDKDPTYARRLLTASHTCGALDSITDFLDILQPAPTNIELSVADALLSDVVSADTIGARWL